MPKYRFTCEHCGIEIQKYATSSTVEIECSSCQYKMFRQHPSLSGPAGVTEVVDKYTGIKHRPDQSLEIKQRKDEYYWTVEVPRLVNSGIYTVETMFENGWIYLDDNHQVKTQTKPPHKR